jgi:hypothetical protein
MNPRISVLVSAEGRSALRTRRVPSSQGYATPG